MPSKKRQKSKTQPEGSQPGLMRSYLHTHFSTLPDSLSFLKNGHVFYAYLSTQNSRAQVSRTLKLQFPDKTLPSVLNSRIKSLVTQVLKFKKLTEPKRFEQFNVLCNDYFNLVVENSAEGVCDKDIDDASIVDKMTDIVPSFHVISGIERAKSASPFSTPHKTPHRIPQPVPSSSARSTRSSCQVLTPRKQKLRRRLQFVSENKVAEAKRFKAKIKFLTSKIKCPPRVVNQALKRKNVQLRLKENKIKELRTGSAMATELAATKAELAEVRRAHAKLKNYHKKRRVSAAACVPLHQHRQIKRQLQAERDDLELQLKEKHEKPDDTSFIFCKKDGKTYNSNYRRCMYQCILHQVPVEATGQLIQDIVDEMTGNKLDSVADASTVSQCAYELSILADIQVAEALEKEEFVNIAWDATSLDAEHVNEVHVNFQGVDGGSHKSLVMQVEILAGGKTTDYVQHISQAIRDVTTSYSEYHKINSMEFNQRVVKKLKSTLSDRVSVNHCVRMQLQEELEIDLLELKCNVHPLDGLASECRKTLKTLDKQSEFQGSLFGKEACAATVVYSISKMRYKNGKGDPKGFKHFIKTNNIKHTMVIRYVGNRMHVLFHLAGTFYFLREKLLLYLTKSCNCQTGFRTSLIKDFSSPHIQNQMKALGLVGKLLTGPWMSVLYGNKENISNLEAVPLLKTCVAKLKALLQKPSKILEVQEDCFGQPLTKDAVLASLRVPVDQSSSEQFEHTIGALLQACVLVLDRQLSNYITGDLSSPSPRMLEVTKCAPVHNIASERILGLTDSQYRRAPNATVGFIDGKVKGKKNRTLDWLKTKSDHEQDQLISYAISRSRKYRDIRKEREAQTTIVYQRRLKEKIQNKDRLFRSRVEKKINAAIAHIPEDFELQILSVFFTVDKAILFEVLKFLEDPDLLVGRYIYQVWDMGESGDVLYYGKIQELKTSKTKPPTLSIAYWLPDEAEYESSDYIYKVSIVLTDYMLGDLTFSA